MSANPLLSWVSTVDHKRIGLLYIMASGALFLAGGIEALLMRIPLAFPGNAFLSPETYNQIFTMHGTTMVFLVVVLLLVGLSTYLVPLMIGARDVVFPRLNELRFWLFVCGGALLYFSFLAGGARDAGWFSYTPLSEQAFSSSQRIDYWAWALLVIGAGTIAGAINLTPGRTP